ncbi:MAG: hypothetical protein ACIALR_04830 [Blastopirellula sp. JB062]
MPSKYETYRRKLLHQVAATLGIPSKLVAGAEFNEAPHALTDPIKAGSAFVETDAPQMLWLEADQAVEVLDAAAGDGEADPTKPKRFKMIAYTGGLMRPSGFSIPVVLDLSRTKVAAGSRPIFLSHDPDKPLGHAAAGDIVISANRITAQGLLSAVNEWVDQVKGSSANGFPWRASIGAPYSQRTFVAEGETAKVNGRTFKGPLWVVADAELMEISFVTLAGDDRTSAVVAHTGQSKEGKQDMPFDQWLTAKGFDVATLTDGTKESLHAMWEAEQGSESGEQTGDGSTSGGTVNAAADGSALPNVQNLLAEFRTQQAADVERVNKIRTIVAGGNLAADEATKIEAEAIRAGWSADRAELEVMRKGRANGGEFAIHAGAGGANVPTPGTLVASFAQSFGKVPEAILARDISAEDMDKATSVAHRYCSLHALMDLVILKANGHGYSGTRKSNDFIRAALRADRQINSDGYSSLNASSGFSSISLAGICLSVSTPV